MIENIEAKIAEIRRELGEETATRLNPVLKEIEMDYKDKLETISTVNNESKTRKLKLREYEEKLLEKEEEVKRLSNDEEVKRIKAENERLRRLEEQVINEKKQKLSARLSQISEHTDFEKLKNTVKIPDPVEGKYLADTLKPDEVDTILGKIDEYSNLGLFAVSGQRTGGNGQNFKVNKDEKFFGYADPVELQQKNPELYREWRKARGYAK